MATDVQAPGIERGSRLHLLVIARAARFAYCSARRASHALSGRRSARRRARGVLQRIRARLGRHRARGLCIHDHSRMVVLRRTMLAVPVQQMNPRRVPRPVGARDAFVREREGRPRVESVRHPQWAHGGAEPHRVSAVTGIGWLRVAAIVTIPTLPDSHDVRSASEPAPGPTPDWSVLPTSGASQGQVEGRFGPGKSVIGRSLCVY